MKHKMAEDVIAIVPETADSTARASTTATGKQGNKTVKCVVILRSMAIFITPTVANSNINNKPLNFNHQPWSWLLGGHHSVSLLLGLYRLHSSVSVSVLALRELEASRQCCLCSLSYTPLPGV